MDGDINIQPVENQDKTRPKSVSNDAEKNRLFQNSQAKNSNNLTKEQVQTPIKTQDNNFFGNKNNDIEYDEQTDGELNQDDEYGAEIGFDENA
jgi:hypothetical protein